jgi:SMC interacting uncharacterized protein involved in chromosome segregation
LGWTVSKSRDPKGHVGSIPTSGTNFQQIGDRMPVKKGNPKKGEGQNLKEQIVHEFHIISEGLVSQIKQVAEGVANVDQKLDRTRQELKAEIEEKTQPIAQAVVSMEGRLSTLDAKVSNLDVKLDRIHQELKGEIQKTK